ncbi:MAG TPA: AMP-binding protein [Chthoniobacteraceae bacterium]|jgi:acyl-[acyl-carrier-protein]-phospholipid O-acyltransferase/long-chain-fatty-acid--[acyl-carrier-protein] ligase
MTSSSLGSALRAFGRSLAFFFYRVTPFGQHWLPEKGGFLLLPNHLTWVDAVILQIACPRPIRFIIDAGIYQQRLLNPILRAFGTLPISPKRARDAVRIAAECIQAGEIVCIFPEGELSRTGMLLRLRRGYELIAKASGAPVVPVWLDRLWGSVFSFEGGKFFFKWPRRIPYPVSVAFGAPMTPEEADIALVRERFLELGEFCYQQRPELEGHLARACVRGLKKGQWHTAVIDGMDHSKLSSGMLLAAAIALSQRIKKDCASSRISIVLPPGKAAVLANLAVTLAGKTPVNLNFTAGRSSVEAALRIGQVRDCLTARPFVKRLPDFPWPSHLLQLDEILPPLKPQIIAWRCVVAILPAWALSAFLRLPRTGDRDEAVILFTSGSSGEPKGVVLSHRNLLGNVSQFSIMLNLGRKDTVLACLPFFHSFGSTVTLWYPLIEGVRAVTYPNPLEISKNADLIERYGVTLFCTTPTFLRGYLRKIEPAQMRSLELIVTGAERLPPELAEAFRERFGKEILQGYGLTETAPVAAVNLPEPKASRPGDNVQPSNRLGSVGKLAPGMAAQIRDPESGARLTLHDTGMLWLRGPNIFEGYLNDPERSAEVLVDRWFKTGDLARFDEDGFCFIEGRLSRFSKIGGEMVPHETVESKIAELLELPKDERLIAIAGIPDEAKGEALVLLAATEIDAADLRKKLTDGGMPNLWIPRIIRRIDAIPILGSGKLDLSRCKEAALADSSPPA